MVEIARRLGARRSLGFFDCFDEHVRVEPSQHMFDLLFTIPQHLRPLLRLEDFTFAPQFSPAADAAAERFIATLRAKGERFLFLHPETRPQKMWTKERFSWVVDRFLNEKPEYKVLVSSRAPYDLGVHAGRVIQIDDHLELTLAMLPRCDLFLGVDSCFLHAADLFRLPAVGLFGASPTQWGLRLSPRSRHVVGRSMDEIVPQRVLEDLLEVAEYPLQATAAGGTLGAFVH